MQRLLAAFQRLCVIGWLISGLAGHAHAAPAIYLYEGNSCSVATQNAAARNMLGRTEDGDVLFIDFSHNADYAYTNVDYGLGCYQGQVANVALSVPLALTSPSAGGYGLTSGAVSLSDVAAGKLDAFFAHVAHSAVSHGFPAAQMRLGWEMNGNWYPWKAQGQTATFNAAFCRAKADMQAAEPSARFTYWLNPSTNADASTEHPDECMDASTGVAWDQYESYWTQGGQTAEPGAWTHAYDGWWGIDSLGQWYSPARHAVPEFGVGLETSANASTTADDPAFMAQLIAYDASQGAEFMGLWDTPAWTGYPGKITDGSHPGEALEIMKAWSAKASLLAGAKLYTGPITATPPVGYHQILAQLANGDVEQLAWGDQPGQTLQATDLTARAQASARPTFTVTNAQGATAMVTPNANGSAIADITFPATSAPVDYVFTPSAPRAIGFSDGKGGLSGWLWQGGRAMPWFDWKATGGTAQVYVAP